MLGSLGGWLQFTSLSGAEACGWTVPGVAQWACWVPLSQSRTADASSGSRAAGHWDSASLGEGAGSLSVLVTPGEEGVGSVSPVRLEGLTAGTLPPHFLCSWLLRCWSCLGAWRHLFPVSPTSRPLAQSQASLWQMWSLSGTGCFFLHGGPSLFHEFSFLFF